MGYLGNPRMVLMGQDSMPIANYEYPADPTATSNPTRVPVSWLNTLTGKIWICTDNTTDANIWKGGHRGALVYKTTGQAVPHNTETIATFDAEEYDTDGFHDNSTNNSYITIPSGVSKVRFAFGMNWQANSTGRRQARLYKNGSTKVIGLPTLTWDATSFAAGWENATASAVIDVEVGDYFEMAVFQNSGGNLDIDPDEDTYLSIEVIE